MRNAASTCVSCALGCVLVAFGCALLASCTASAEDVRPPPAQLFFPSGLAVGPGMANVLFVANSNSELRYDSGSISVIDVNVVASAVNAWVTNRDEGGCEADLDHSETLICDETMFMKPGASVRIGNFATDIAVQDFTPPGGPVKLRVIVPTRGDPSVAWADYDGDTLSCHQDPEGFPQCDEAHRLTSVHNDPDLPAIQDEPFAVFATAEPPDPTSGARPGFAVVTHLTTGSATLIDSPEDGTVQIADVAFALFGADNQGGLRGATGIWGRRPDDPASDAFIMYVGSRSDNRVQTVTVGRPENRTAPYLLAGNFLLLDAVGASPGIGSSIDTRGVVVSDTTRRMYVVNRRPPSLQIFDTTLGPTGVPRNAPLGATDICRQASNVAVLDFGTAGSPDERAYVTCFQDGEVYVVDPSGHPEVEDIITVGRGPYAVAAAKDHKLLFVSNFLEDTIAVIDVDPARATRNRVVLRIGEPRSL